MIRLSQEFGAHTGRQLTFEQDRVRLGRAPSNEVAFDPNVDLDASGNHCEIVREQGAYVVVDLGSRNGTYVNGQRVAQRQRLAHGDVLECGRGGPRLRIDLGGAAAAAGMGTAPPGGGGYTSPMGGMGGGFAPHPPGPGAPGAMGPAHGTAPPGGGSPFLGGNTPPPAHGFGAPPNPPAYGGPAPVPFAATPPPPNPYGTTPPPPMAPHPGGGFGAPPAGGFNPVPPAAGAPHHHGGGPAGPAPGSVGAAVAAALPPGAQVGKRTVAMMIDQAIARAAPKRSTTGLKVAMVLTVLLVVAGLSVGGYFLWADREDRNNTANNNTDGAGERISTQNEGAIYLLAQVRPGQARPQGFCTGFAVTQDLIATNAHCVQVAREMMGRGAQLVALRNNGRGMQTPVQPVYQDPRFRDATQGLEGSGFDVGLMRSAMPLPNTVRLASLDDVMRLRSGVRIYVYGFPGLTMNEVSPVATITEGLLNRSTDFFDRAADPPVAQKVQHTAQTTSGSSGSPIFLANNTVIAINAGSLADEERQNILDPRTGQRVNVEVNRSSNFKYGMRADLIRQAIQQVGETAP